MKALTTGSIFNCFNKISQVLYSIWKRGNRHEVFWRKNVLKIFTQSGVPSYLELFFQVANLPVYYESTPSPLLSGWFFEIFSEQHSMTALARLHLTKNDYMAEKTQQVNA